jgi:hypothetical protein
MSYTADSCRSEFTTGQYERAESFLSLVTDALVDYTVTIINSTYDNSNTVTVIISSSHPFITWNVNISTSFAVEFSATDTPFTTVNHTFTNVPNGELDVSVGLCYPYVWPEDGSTFCLMKIRWITLTGANYTVTDADDQTSTTAITTSSSAPPGNHTDTEYSNEPESSGSTDGSSDLNSGRIQTNSAVHLTKPFQWLFLAVIFLKLL